MPKKFNLILISFYFLSLLLPAKKAVADTPRMYTNFLELSYSYNECRQKAAEVGSFVLPRYKVNTSSRVAFTQVLGKTSDTSAHLTCIERNNGSYFVVVASSDFEEEEASSIVERVINFMKEK